MQAGTGAGNGSAHKAHGALRAHRSNDVVAHASSLSSWQQQYDQLNGGTFRGSLDELWFEDVQIFQERTSHAVRQICRIREDAVWCGVTVKHDGSRIEGAELGRDGVMVCGESAEFELLTPDGHEIFGIVVSRNALLKHADAVGVPLDPGLLGHATWLPCETEFQSRLRNCLGFLLHQAPMNSALGCGPAAGLSAAGVQDGERAQRRAQQAALDALLEVLRPRAHLGDHPTERAGFGRRRQLVRRVCAHVQASTLEVPTVPDLCAAFHVSRRTLQYAFEEVVGSSPVVYLRRLRLNAVYRDVIAGTAWTVQDAAAGHGFWSLSQFASDYRRLFGERPSETLMRARAAPQTNPPSIGAVPQARRR